MHKNNVVGKRFGEIAIERRFITEDDLQKALAAHNLLYKKSKVYAPIGKILVRMGAMNREQVKMVLMAQDKWKKENRHSHKKHPSKTTDLRQKNVPLSCRSLSRNNLSSSKKHMFRLKVSDKAMFASFYLMEEGPSDLTAKEVLLFLEEKGIRFGVANKETIKKFIETRPVPKKPLLIARGKFPSPGTPPKIIYHFDLDPLKIGTIREDGTIDWKNRGRLPVVKKGDLLAEKIEGKEGKPGVDIYGEEILPEEIVPVILKKGNGTRISPDGLKVYATRDGMPKLDEDGCISVLPKINIEGDVCLNTGHIYFDGHVIVSGLVQRGYRVKAKSLMATGLEGADVEVVQDIDIMGGIYGSRVKAKENLRAGHIHGSSLNVLGNILVQKEIINSRMEVNGECALGGARIIDSEIIAKKGIIAHDIGSEGARPSILTVGFDSSLRKKINDLKREIYKKRKRIKGIEKDIDELKIKNKGMVKTRVDQDKRADQETHEGYLENTLQDSGLHTADTTTCIFPKGHESCIFVGSGTEETVKDKEKTDERIEVLERERDTLQMEIEEINAKIDALTEDSKGGKGIPTVRVYGKIYPKTVIITPHCRYVAQEPLKRVLITETRQNIQGKWHVEIRPLW